jgi:hypothetical protein
MPPIAGPSGDRRATAKKDAQQERPLATPDVRELAARDHQGRHHQGEERDGRLDTRDRGAEIL